jgi:type IV pilus assembly protein PilW
MTHGTATLRSGSPRLQRGMSLVELMISVTIGLVILGALVALFVNTSRTNREMAKTNGLIENGRLAIQLIGSDLVHAGFWDTHVPEYDNQTSDVVPTDMPTAVPDPCLTYDPTTWTTAYKRNLVDIPVQVYDSDATCNAIVVNKWTDSDVLVVRHADTCRTTDGGNCAADVAGSLYFQATQCLAEAPAPYVLGTTGFDRHKRDCTAAASKRLFVSNLYYIADVGGVPTLMRSQYSYDGASIQPREAQPMIEGIEGFHVQLGIDDVSETGAAVDYTAAVAWQDNNTRVTATNRGDGVPDDDFVSCTTGAPCTAGELMNVTAVKLYVLVRSPDITRNYTDTKTYNLGDVTLGPYNDGYRRHVFETVVRLPNIAGRRFTP